MDGFVAILNALANAILCLAAAYAVVSPKIRDGVLAKLGLVAISIGFGVSAGVVLGMRGCDAAVSLSRAHLMVHIGLLIVVVAWWMRSRRHRQVLRRASDWMDLEDAAGPRASRSSHG